MKLAYFRILTYIPVILNKNMGSSNSYIRLVSCLIVGVIIGLASIPLTAASTFKDVSSKTKHADAINFVHDRHIVDGMPDGTYHPEQHINRAELVKVVMLATHAPGLDTAVFSAPCASDLSLDNWATKYICYSKVANLIDGYPDNTFKPWQSVTYAEALKIVMNSFGLVPPQSDAPWYEAYQALALADGIALPTTDLFSPLDRADMAELITRAVQYNQANPNITQLRGVGDYDLLPTVSLPIPDISSLQPQESLTDSKPITKPEVSHNIDHVSPDTTIHQSQEPIAPNGYYKNTDNISVARPYQSSSVPSEATAQCRDGSYSSSLKRSGTCAHHGGVLTWL